MTETEVLDKWLIRYIDAKKRLAVLDGWLHLYENDFEEVTMLIIDRKITGIPDYPSREHLLEVLNTRNTTYLEICGAAKELARLGLEVKTGL